MSPIADRSVSINLRARVSDFVAGMGQAKKSTEDLSRQMVQTGAYADQFRRRLEAATKALPKIEIDADSSPAEIKFAELRAEMEKLSTKRIGIDIDAATAQVQLQEIQRELEKLQGQSATIDVKADIGSALAELRAVDAEVSRVNGQDARVSVDADVGSALASIALVGAALAALPAVTTLAVGVTALGGAFAAAGIGAAAFSAVAVPSLGRINDALKAQATAAQSAGSATGGAGQSAAQAAQQAMQLEQAEKRLKDAQMERKQAQEDLTRATEAGRRALEDLNFSLERSVLSQKDAALAVREAEARLLELQSKGDSSDLEIERAMLNVEMAHQRAREQEVKTTRAKKDTAEANKAGVKGTAEYQKGLDKLTQAEAKVTQAADQLKMAHLQQQAAMSGGGGGAAKLKDAFADLSAAEKTLAKDLKGFQDEYVAWQRSLEPDVFPVIAQGLDLMRLGLKEAGPLAKTAASSFLTLGKDAERALTGPFWQQFLFNVNTQMPAAIVGLGRSFGNVATGVAGVIDAFLPFTPTVVGGLEKASAAFAKWGQELKSSNGFAEFLLFVQQHAPAVWQTVKDLAASLENIGKAVAPLGAGAFSGLGLLAKLVAGMDPEHIRLIALAIIAIKAAQAGLKVASFFTDFVSKVGELKGKVTAFGDGVDKVKTKAGGLKGAISGLADSFGGLSGLVGGAAIAGGMLILDQRFAAAAKSAEQFTEKVQASAGTNLDNELAALNQELQKQIDLQGPNIAGWVYLTDAGKEAGDRVDALRDRISDLNHQKELAAIKAKTAGDSIATMGGQADTTAGQVGGLDQSLGSFAARTDALQAIHNMEGAFKAARDAIDAANGKLQINAGMTDKQRDAVILAREKFSGYISSIKTAADGAQTLSGRTTDATRAVLEQLPKLGELAGKNGEARAQILLLAQAYGISKADAEKAMKSASGLKDVLDKLKSKEIRLGLTLDTQAAEKGIESFIKRYNNKSLAIAIAAKVKAAGGIQTTGGVDLMAAGGMKGSSSVSPPPPNIATSATYVAGSGTVYGEAGREAYIPYAGQYRGRAIQILGQVASDFGLQVFNAQAAKQVDSLTGGLKETQYSVSSGLSQATSMLSDTLGDAGTLTSTVASVGTVGQQMSATWAAGAKTVSDSVVGVNSAIGISSDMIVKSNEKVKDAALTVADVLAKATAAILSAAKGGSGKGSQGSTNAPAPGGSKGSGKGSQGSTNVPAPGSVAPGAAKPQNMVKGDYGLYGLQGAPDASLTNYSRTSAPQQQSAASVSASRISSAEGVNGGSGPGGGSAGTSVNFYGTTIQDSMDADVVTAKIGIVLDSRG